MGGFSDLLVDARQIHRRVARQIAEIGRECERLRNRRCALPPDVADSELESACDAQREIARAVSVRCRLRLRGRLVGAWTVESEFADFGDLLRAAAILRLLEDMLAEDERAAALGA
jgi:hypothetical protein